MYIHFDKTILFSDITFLVLFVAQNNFFTLLKKIYIIREHVAIRLDTSNDIQTSKASAKTDSQQIWQCQFS